MHCVFTAINAVSKRSASVFLFTSWNNFSINPVGVTVVFVVVVVSIHISLKMSVFQQAVSVFISWYCNIFKCVVVEPIAIKTSFNIPNRTSCSCDTCAVINVWYTYSYTRVMFNNNSFWSQQVIWSQTTVVYTCISSLCISRFVGPNNDETGPICLYEIWTFMLCTFLGFDFSSSSGKLTWFWINDREIRWETNTMILISMFTKQDEVF